MADQRERSFAPGAADGVGDLVVPGSVGAVAAGAVESAAAVAVVGAALHADIAAGDAAF